MSDKVKPWSSVGNILADIQDANERLKTGKTTADNARAEARFYAAGLKAVAIMSEHARVSGRIKKGDSIIPDVGIRTGYRKVGEANVMEGDS